MAEKCVTTISHHALVTEPAGINAWGDSGVGVHGDWKHLIKKQGQANEPCIQRKVFKITVQSPDTNLPERTGCRCQS